MRELFLKEISISASLIFKIGLALTVVFSLIIVIFYLQKLIKLLINNFISPQLINIYEKIIKPEVNWLALLWFLGIADIGILITAKSPWLKVGEIFLSLGIIALTVWLSFQWLKRLFDTFLLDVALQKKRKLNSEFFIIAKYSANVIVGVIVIFIFAQVHNINLFGLLASLGIGGLAIAFAAQKTLEQLLGGIVLYIDRPFVQDDYIGLADGTFGRVESIGLRSTKIRTSGKGTLMIIPNSSLTQINIENFTGAKKVISLVYLNFYRNLPPEERALIKQIILDSTNDIFGIDSRSSDVIFKDIVQDSKNNITQAQVNFFLLGSGEVSMELRRQLLDMATHNISQTLKEYGISFDLENKTINVESPITI
jgi:MscS family membrane protein